MFLICKLYLLKSDLKIDLVYGPSDVHLKAVFICNRELADGALESWWTEFPGQVPMHGCCWFSASLRQGGGLPGHLRFPGHGLGLLYYICTRCQQQSHSFNGIKHMHKCMVPNLLSLAFSLRPRPRYLSGVYYLCSESYKCGSEIGLGFYT